MVDGSTEEMGQGRSGDHGQFAGSTNRDERVSGPFYIGRSSFRMGVVEGDVVLGQIVGGHTPARGIGNFPIDADDEWEVSPDWNRGEALSILPLGSPEESLWEEDEATTVFVNTDAIPASRVTARPVVAVIAVAGLVGGVLALSGGLATRFPSALIGRAVMPLLGTAHSREQPRSASAPTSSAGESRAALEESRSGWPESTSPDSSVALLTSPERSCARETLEPPAVTTEVAPPGAPRGSAVNAPRKSPKRPQIPPSQAGSTSADTWVDPWAD